LWRGIDPGNLFPMPLGFLATSRADKEMIAHFIKNNISTGILSAFEAARINLQAANIFHQDFSLLESFLQEYKEWF
jgi:hypothetical protein